jgi:hypothetical protein
MPNKSAPSGQGASSEPKMCPCDCHKDGEPYCGDCMDSHRSKPLPAPSATTEDGLNLRRDAHPDYLFSLYMRMAEAHSERGWLGVTEVYVAEKAAMKERFKIEPKSVTLPPSAPRVCTCPDHQWIGSEPNDSTCELSEEEHEALRVPPSAEGLVSQYSWDTPTAEKSMYESIAKLKPEERTVMQGYFKRYFDLLCSSIETSDSLRTSLTAAQDERDAAMGSLEAQRTSLCNPLKAIRDAIKAREWLRLGRGSYEWDDDRWRDEFGDAIDAIESARRERKLRELVRDFANHMRSDYCAKCKGLVARADSLLAPTVPLTDKEEKENGGSSK